MRQQNPKNHPAKGILLPSCGTLGYLTWSMVMAISQIHIIYTQISKNDDLHLAGACTKQACWL